MIAASVFTTASLLAVASARITGIAVPEVIRPGDTIDVVIHSSNYIQSVYDVAIAVGHDIGDGTPESLGAIDQTFYLGPLESNLANDFTKKITIPPPTPWGPGVVKASLMSLYGALHMPTLSNYNVTITFGDKTSDKYISSQ